MKKKLIKLISFVLIIAALFYFFYPLRSLAVMGIYSAQHEKESVMRQNGFEIDMPSGRGWYPFVMTFNADGFKRFSGLDAKMSIMYNFGAFDLSTRTSSIYDTDSEYYSSFYGAYVIEENGGVFGFDENGWLDMDEVSLAVKYDYTKLVIEDFGCEKPVFGIDDTAIEEGITFAQTDGWTRIDAVLNVNGCAHGYDGYKTPYLQYGRPFGEVETDFEETQLFGRVYAKYFEEYGCTVMAYIIAPNTDTLENCDIEILSETTIAPIS